MEMAKKMAALLIGTAVEKDVDYEPRIPNSKTTQPTWTISISDEPAPASEPLLNLQQQIWNLWELMAVVECYAYGGFVLVAD